MQLSPRLAWNSFLAAVILVPVAVGVVPLSGVPLTLNVFVQAKVIVASVALALALAAWGLTSAREGASYVGRALIPLGVFVAVAALSTATAIEPRLAFFGDSEQGVGLLVLLMSALACYLVTQLVRDEERLRRLTSAVILTAAAVAAIGLVQQLAAFDLLGVANDVSIQWMRQRGFGTIGNPDTYGAYLVLPAMLALHRLRQAPRAERLRWGACLAAILTSCVASQTRGAIAGLAVGIVAYGLAQRRAPKETAAKGQAAASKTSRSALALVSSAAVAVGLFVAVLDGGQTGFPMRFGNVKSLLALGGRLPLWASALKIASGHPLLGVGPDSFRLGWYPVRELAHVAAGVGLVITDPHSVPLLIIATMGVLGLTAAAFMLVTAVLGGFKTLPEARGHRGLGHEYEAWLWGFIALSVTLLSSMLTSVLAFMFFLAMGVLVAPRLRPAEAPPRAATLGIHAASLLAALALLVFGVLTTAAQVTAASARGVEANLARARAAMAASLAPWDSGLQDLKYETAVQAALEHLFTGQPDGAGTVDATKAQLAEAARQEPREYLHPYRTALLLIGVGEKLGARYAEPGIEAGLRGLAIYPNSVELRTGVASGYLQLSEPEKAVAVLKGVWDADPNYLQSGRTYVEALLAQGDRKGARQVLSVLQERFPQEPAIDEVARRIGTD